MNKKENFENWFYNLCEKIGKIIDDNDLLITKSTPLYSLL